MPRSSLGVGQKHYYPAECVCINLLLLFFTCERIRDFGERANSFTALRKWTLIYANHNIVYCTSVFFILS